jgi:hypothetical protein
LKFTLFLIFIQVLKLLGVKKYGGRYQPSDPRINKRRLYGSMSSLPSSVSSRPIRDKRRQDERKKVKDIKVQHYYYYYYYYKEETFLELEVECVYDCGNFNHVKINESKVFVVILVMSHSQGINKRFQRLESHVVTLARSVAHLSSEMRTQHLMIQVYNLLLKALAIDVMNFNISESLYVGFSVSNIIINSSCCL